MKFKKKTYFIFMLFLFLFLLSSYTNALEVNIANSKDWKDVYSVLLYSKEQNKKGLFVNSESIVALTKILPKTAEITIYQSKKNPYIPNLESQLKSAGYNVKEVITSNDFNYDLNKDKNKFLIISEDNYRLSIALPPLALKGNYGVLILSDKNIDRIVPLLKNSKENIAIGTFRRDYYEKIKPYITERINEDNLYLDSKAIVEKIGKYNTIILADGTALESEFFYTGNPVLLVGHNKVDERIFDFLIEKNVKSVVIVGNNLAVIGETIREKSNKKISVFIKFGQSDVTNSGKIYSLTIFPLPVEKPKLNVEKTIYDPEKKELYVYFENIGTTPLYELSTIVIKNGNEEIASIADEKPIFLGKGEKYVSIYKINLPLEKLNENTIAEFYTSFGATPSELDSFLTMKNKYGPPFSLPLKVETINEDPAKLTFVDAAYYPSLKRVGVTLKNNGTTKVYYKIKIKNLIVNGLEKDLYKEGKINPGEEKTTYLPVVLDKVDIEENEIFDINILYGSKKDLMTKKLTVKPDFKTESTSIVGLVTSTPGGGLIALAIIVLIIMIAVILIRAKKSK